MADDLEPSPQPHVPLSAAEYRPRDPANVRWYLPTWPDRLRLMGWQNMLWLPAIVPVILLISLPFQEALTLGQAAEFAAWWKLIILAVAAPFTFAMVKAGTALRDRRDPFCIHCGYSLVGLEEGHSCPECGEITSEAMCRQYQRDPYWFIERYKAGQAMTPADRPASAGTPNMLKDMGQI